MSMRWVVGVVCAIMMGFSGVASAQSEGGGDESDPLVPPTASSPSPARSDTEQDAPGGWAPADRHKVDALAAAQAQAQQKVESLEGKLSAAEEKLKDTRDDLTREKNASAVRDLERDSKLMSLGLTVGFGVAVQLPLGSAVSGNRQTSTEFAAMPYAMVLPTYWFAKQPLREYCASSWAMTDDAEATGAALAAARKLAVNDYPRVMEDAGRMTDQELVDYWFEADKDLGKMVVKEIRKGKPAEVVVNLIARKYWDQRKGGTCWHRRVGVWLGKPLSYDAVTILEGSDSPGLERNVDPTVAFGLGFSPNSYFSILAGLTLARVSTDEDQARVIKAGTIAIGGNFDLLGQVFKK